jgi:hypothetical protein
VMTGSGDCGSQKSYFSVANLFRRLRHGQLGDFSGQQPAVVLSLADAELLPACGLTMIRGMEVDAKAFRADGKVSPPCGN